MYFELEVFDIGVFVHYLYTYKPVIRPVLFTFYLAR